MNIGNKVRLILVDNEGKERCKGCVFEFMKDHDCFDINYSDVDFDCGASNYIWIFDKS